MKSIIKSMVIIAMVMMLGTVKSSAQPSIPDPGPGTGGSGYTPNGNSGGGDGGVPFDGGLSLILLAAGVGLGAKRKGLNTQPII